MHINERYGEEEVVVPPEIIDASQFVYLAPSLLKHAGRGVFAKRNFKKNEILTFYDGFFVTKAQDLTYAIDTTTKDTFIIGYSQMDDWKNRGLAQLINDPICGHFSNKEVNVYFVQKKVCNTLVVRALRDISCDEELFVSYGYAYWNCRERYNLLHLEMSFEDYSNHLKYHIQFNTLQHLPEKLRLGFVIKCRQTRNKVHFTYNCIYSECAITSKCSSDLYEISFGSSQLRAHCPQCKAKISETMQTDNATEKADCQTNVIVQ